MIIGGSSPRARGTPNIDGMFSPECRFIPAGAGNTGVDNYDDLPVTVHPRGRGEHTKADALNPGGSGSSPRARGTLFQ